MGSLLIIPLIGAILKSFSARYEYLNSSVSTKLAATLFSGPSRYVQLVSMGGEEADAAAVSALCSRGVFGGVATPDRGNTPTNLLFKFFHSSDESFNNSLAAVLMSPTGAIPESNLLSPPSDKPLNDEDDSEVVIP